MAKQLTIQEWKNKTKKKPRFKTIFLNFKLNSEVKTNTGKGKMKPQNFQN